MKSNRNPFIVLTILAAIALIALSGCAIGGGAKATRTIGMDATGKTNSVNEVVKTSPFVAFGDAVQKVSSVKAGNTKSGNSIGVTGVDQETSGTNAVQFLHEMNELLKNLPK